MRVIAADSPQIPLATRLLGSAIAEHLYVVVLVLRSYVSIYKKLSCAFLISIIRKCQKMLFQRRFLIHITNAYREVFVDMSLTYLFSSSSSDAAAMLPDVRGLLPI